MIGRLLERAGRELYSLADWVVPIAVPRPDRRRAILPFIRPLVDFNDMGQGLADLLPWNLKIDPTTIITRDLAFSRTYRIQAKRDLSWAPRATRNEVNDRLNLALRELGEGWMIHDHLDRRAIRSYPRADFPDPASWLVDQERQMAFESGRHYGSAIYRTFTYLAPRDAEAKVDSVLYRYEKKGSETAMRFDAAQQTFEGAIDRMLTILREDYAFEPLGLREAGTAAGGSMHADDQLALFLRLLSGLHQPVRAVEGPEIISELLADRMTRLADGVLRIGDMLVRPITVVEYPRSSTPELLDALEMIPGNFSIGWRWIARDPAAAQREMRSLRGRNLQKRTGISDTLIERPDALIDPEAIRGANDATDAFGQSRSREVAFGYFSMSLVAYEPVAGDLRGAHERVTALAATLAGRLRADGFIVVTDQDNELETLLGHLPANGHANVVRGMLSSRNLANFMPGITLWTGEWTAPDVENYGKDRPPLAVFSGHGATPFAFNMHAGKRGGHSLLIGDTGAGKTALAGFLISQHRKYPNSQQIVIDSQEQHLVHLRAVGGRHVLLAPDAPDGLSPFAGSDPDEIPVKEKIVAMMIEQQGLDPRQYGEEIYTALQYINHGRPEDQTVSGLMSAPGVSRELRRALREYSREGIAGRLFDNPPTQRPDIGMTVFETGELKNNRSMHVIALVALDLEIERLCERRRPTLIVSEEFWEMLSHRVGAELFLRGLKTKRRKGAAYLLITQNLADIDKSEIADAVIGSCVTKLLLPNENANGDAAGRYERLGLAAWERQALAGHAGRHAVYVMQPDGRRMVDTTLGPVAQATVMQSSTKALERAEAFITQFGEDWHPELVAAQFEPERSPDRADIAESWRRHAYYYPRRNDEGTLPATAPEHVTPHPSDPFGEHIDSERSAAAPEAA